MTAKGPRYSDDPRCFRCRHPLVVHRGKDHAGACCGIRCRCASFIQTVANGEKL